MKLPRNIEVRRAEASGRAIFYIRATVAGKRIFQSSGLDANEANLQAARGIRDAVLREAHVGRFAELESTQIRTMTPFCSIGEVLDRYEEVCLIRRDVTHETMLYNVAAMLRILTRVRGIGEDAARKLSTAVLTDELVEQWAGKCLEGVAGGAQEDSAKRTCNATLRHARCLFKSDIVRQYRGLKLPDVRGFMEAYAVECPAVRYELPAAEEYTAVIHDARTNLRERNPELYAAFILCFDLALRADEAAAARWSWLEHEDVAGAQRWRLAVVDRPGEDWRPKGRGGAVPVAPGVLEALEAAVGRRDGDPYILPGGTRTARYDLAMRGLAKWMRGLGWRRRKCAHELRKLKGSFWRARCGLDRAFEWLRHANYQTTVDYYARIPIRDEPERIDG
jgi:integrase